jgi:hypothetical protein
MVRLALSYELYKPNAYFPIVKALDSMTASVRLGQELNAQSPILVIVDGIVMLSI